MTRTLLALAACLAVAANAADIAGVKLEDRAQVQGSELVLNGAGLRTRLVFDVYVIGLYLPEKKSDPEAVLALAGNKRIVIRMLRDVGAEQFTAALVDGVRANHAEAEFRKLEPRLQELAAIMVQLKEAKKGMTITLELVGSQTQLAVDGKPTGRPILGDDFYRALLRIWLGDKPAQEDVKKGLLGRS